MPLVVPLAETVGVGPRDGNMLQTADTCGETVCNLSQCGIPLYLSVVPLIHRMRKRSFLIVLLFLVAVVHTEIPEQIRLSDDISNDFVVSAYGDQTVHPRAVSEEVAPASGSGSVEAVPPQTVQGLRLPSAAQPFRLSGQDRLLLWSIQRT